MLCKKKTPEETFKREERQRECGHTGASPDEAEPSKVSSSRRSLSERARWQDDHSK